MVRNFILGVLAGFLLAFFLGFFLSLWNFILAGAVAGFLGARGPTFTKHLFSSAFSSGCAGLLYILFILLLPALSEFLPFIFLPTADSLSLVTGMVIVLLAGFAGGATKSLFFSRAES